MCESTIRDDEQSSNEALPSVGIFWLYGECVIFAERTPVAEGQPYGDAVSGWRDHAEYWEELRSSGSLDVLPEPLREEYFSIPRGRVVYHRGDGTFHVYHGNNVTDEDLARVAAYFGLPAKQTVFEQDLHYCDYDDGEWEDLCYSK